MAENCHTTELAFVFELQSYYIYKKAFLIQISLPHKSRYSPISLKSASNHTFYLNHGEHTYGIGRGFLPYLQTYLLYNTHRRQLISLPACCSLASFPMFIFQP